jgi:outer membrane protein assembly factor BamB
MGSIVIVGSNDNHLYGFERSTGSQRWRLHLGQNNNVVLAPMIYDNEIFFADQNRTLRALNNQNPPGTLWQIALPQPALTSLNNYSDTIYIAVGEGVNHSLLALDRDNGAVRWSKDDLTGPGLRYPVIGDQLLYAADGTIRAYDVINGELVWENTAVQNIMVAPVYGSPGLNSLAELYLFTNDNRIFALDANTGVELWNIDNGEVATSLALNENTLFVAGNDYVKAISRQDRSQRWRSAIGGGPVMGGPLVDANRVLVVTQAGTIHLFNNQDGSAIAVPSIASFAGGAPAVSGAYIFVPGTDGFLYELLGSQ